MYAFLNSGEPYKLIFMGFFGMHFYIETYNRYKVLVFKWLIKKKCKANNSKVLAIMLKSCL